MASWSNVDEIEITRLRAKIVELEASVARNQEWLIQKSNEKVEALHRVQELEAIEKAARSLLSRKDFWIAAATLMTLPGEIDNLADALTPLDAPCEKCGRKLDPHYAYCRNCGTPRPGFMPSGDKKEKT